jgi:hypothetical protein
MRPQTYSVWGERGISRLPCEVLRYVHGVCDRAGSRCTSRYRCTGWGLPLSPTASASRSEFLTRLNTRPAQSPVNASTSPLQVTPHDSGSVWVANPLQYEFFIHLHLAGLTGAQETIDADFAEIETIGTEGIEKNLWLDTIQTHREGTNDTTEGFQRRFPVGTWVNICVSTTITDESGHASAAPTRNLDSPPGDGRTGR